MHVTIRKFTRKTFSCFQFVYFSTYSAISIFVSYSVSLPQIPFIFILYDVLVTLVSFAVSPPLCLLTVLLFIPLISFELLSILPNTFRFSFDILLYSLFFLFHILLLAFFYPICFSFYLLYRFPFDCFEQYSHFI